jgi:aminopeptidase-like protein
MMSDELLGHEMHALAERLWPINRSLMGAGFRESLEMLVDEIPEIEIFEIPSGTQVFDWQVPKEWVIHDAFIISPDGSKICDFSVNNLHVLNYSTAVDVELSLDELLPNLHSLPEQPDAIPYLTSYYKEAWGFCISENEKRKLLPGNYRVFIDSAHINGSLTYGQLILPGNSKKEILLSTYLCHPSMANNELSGPVVTTYLSKLIKTQINRRYTYRVLFLPETVGSIAYLSENVSHLKENVIAGYTITCIGDDRSYSYLPSRGGNSLADAVAKKALEVLEIDYVSYKWTDRGSDERQYCSPGVDLPVASIMRTKYGEYPEYHTSLDNLKDVVTADGLLGGYRVLRKCIEILENDRIPVATNLGEPHLTKYDLYPTLSTKNQKEFVRNIIDILTWSDGTKMLSNIAEIMGIDYLEAEELLLQLEDKGLVAQL